MTQEMLDEAMDALVDDLFGDYGESDCSEFATMMSFIEKFGGNDDEILRN